jgi:hypothetical protein
MKQETSQQVTGFRSAAEPPVFVLGTPYLVLSTLFLTGCGAWTSMPPTSEAALAAQVDSCRTTGRIQLANTSLADHDLAALAGIDNLRELLLDDRRSRITARGIEHLLGLPNLTHLRLRSGVDDAALRAISRIKPLQILNVPNSSFSDAALESLKQLPDLVQLRFGSPNVSDAGMRTLAELPSIKRLHLIDVPITDDGLRELAKIEQLESLYIDGGDFSDAAIDELFRNRPRLHVHLNQQHHDRDPAKHEHP